MRRGRSLSINVNSFYFKIAYVPDSERCRRHQWEWGDPKCDKEITSIKCICKNDPTEECISNIMVIRCSADPLQPHGLQILPIFWRYVFATLWDAIVLHFMKWKIGLSTELVRCEISTISWVQCSRCIYETVHRYTLTIRDGLLCKSKVHRRGLYVVHLRYSAVSIYGGIVQSSSCLYRRLVGSFVNSFMLWWKGSNKKFPAWKKNTATFG